MSSHTYDYLDGNVAAGELSQYLLWMLLQRRASARTAVQRSASPRRVYTCTVPASWRGALFASACSFVWQMPAARFP
jgi:hypothetical protein